MKTPLEIEIKLRVENATKPHWGGVATFRMKTSNACSPFKVKDINQMITGTAALLILGCKRIKENCEVEKLAVKICGRETVSGIFKGLGTTIR